MRHVSCNLWHDTIMKLEDDSSIYMYLFFRAVAGPQFSVGHRSENPKRQTMIVQNRSDGLSLSKKAVNDLILS